MKKIISTFLFFTTFGLCYSQTIHVTNSTGQILGFGVQTTKSTPNICPPDPFASSPTYYILPDVETEISLGPPSDPVIRPYRMGCFYYSGPGVVGTPSWQINTCWNPSCVMNAGSYIITITSCEDLDTYITIE